MIERKAKDTLLRLAGQFQVVAVTGPRQSGKTTLARMTFPDKKYISLDDRDMREIAIADPKDFLAAFPDGAIIDEAQKVPDIFDAIKYVVDSGDYQPGKFILTGSSQFRLRENISDSLAGRVGIINLLPLSLTELEDNEILENDPYKYIFSGLYTPLYDTDKSYIREDWYENYIDTYLNLDVKDHINPSNVRSFNKLIKLCAAYSGQLVNYERFARDIGVSAVTIKEWLSVLETSFIIHFLQPFSTNFIKNVVRTPKMYFIDSGLMCYLLGIDSKEELLLSRYKGAVVETMAISELIKGRYNNARKSDLYFYRDNNKLEVDVIADWKQPLAIEIKSNSAGEKSFSKNVRKYIDSGQDDTTGVVFYLNELSCEINGVRYVPWKDWGKIQ